MFENTKHYDFDDAALETSFGAPVCSSTQRAQVEKRPNEQIDEQNSKKSKLDTEIKKQVLPRCSNSFTENGPTKNSPNKLLDYSYISPGTVVKRRFPGPAGLLPNRVETSKSILQVIEEGKVDKSSDFADSIICSQRAASVFEDGPWTEMSNDLYLPSGEQLFNKFTISWIKKQSKKLLMKYKAPFLAAIIQSLEITREKIPTVHVTLKDSTGNIQGTILHSLYEEYEEFFTTGSVIVLKQFGVLSAGYNNYCLTITPNNLLTIYCVKSAKNFPHGEGGSEGNSVKKVSIQSCSAVEIMKNYNEGFFQHSAPVQTRINFGKLNKKNENLNIKSGGEENCNKFVVTRTFSDELLSTSLNNARIQTSASNSSFDSPISAGVTNVNGYAKKRFIFTQSTDLHSSGGTSKSSDILTNQNVIGENCDNLTINCSNVSTNAYSKKPTSNSNSKRKFNFKQNIKSSLEQFPRKVNQSSSNVNVNDQDVIVNCSQISIKTSNKEHTEIWKNLLEDVDVDSLFEDF